MSDLIERLRFRANGINLDGFHKTGSLLTEAADELSRLQSLSDQNRLTGGWRDIESAPKDGTMVDLWCVTPPEVDFSPELGGIRLSDCSWHAADDIAPHTGWCRITDDGDMDMVESGPRCEFGLPPWIPTHWQPLPSPPLPLPGGEDGSSRALSSTVCGDVAKGSDPIQVKRCGMCFDFLKPEDDAGNSECEGCGVMWREPE